jgi:DNA adenine methylase
MISSPDLMGAARVTMPETDDAGPPGYPGGKNGSGIYQFLINHMPPHSVYVEPFLGMGAILRKKRPAPAGNIAIDIDSDVVHNFKRRYARFLKTLPECQLVCGDALEILASLYLPDDALVFMDPPYLMDTRSWQQNLYRYELSSVEDHQRLLQIALRLRCQVMITGYANKLYEIRLAGWTSYTYTNMTRGGPKIETLWCNFPEPGELHDYRYAGSNFRKREQIKRKKLRWIKRLQRMDPIERGALLAAIDELATGADGAGVIGNSDGVCRHPSSPKALQACIAFPVETGLEVR